MIADWKTFYNNEVNENKSLLRTQGENNSSFFLWPKNDQCVKLKVRLIYKYVHLISSCCKCFTILA